MADLIETTNYIVGKADAYHGTPTLTVNNLSEIFHVSPRTVNRWYREELMKVSTYEYLLNYIETKFDLLTIKTLPSQKIPIGTCNREFFSHLTAFGAHAYGVENLRYQMKEAKGKGLVNQDRLYRFIKKLNEYLSLDFSEGSESEDLATELVERWKEQISDSKAFASNQEVHRFKEWISLCQDGGGE